MTGSAGAGERFGAHSASTWDPGHATATPAATAVPSQAQAVGVRPTPRKAPFTQRRAASALDQEQRDCGTWPCSASCALRRLLPALP